MTVPAYDVVLFDLDGTLVDSGEGVTNSVAHSLEKLGIPVTSRQDLFRFIGPPLIDSYRQFYGLDEETARLALTYYREYYTTEGIFQFDVYEGMGDLLSKLHAAGVRIAVATSKPEEFAKIILGECGLAPYFDVIAGATMDESRVTKEDVITYALAVLGSPDPRRVLMVGDRKFDVLGAKKLGMDSVGVLFGYGSRGELQDAGATYIVPTVKEISFPILGT